MLFLTRNACALRTLHIPYACHTHLPNLRACWTDVGSAASAVRAKPHQKRMCTAHACSPLPILHTYSARSYTPSLCCTSKPISLPYPFAKLACVLGGRTGTCLSCARSPMTIMHTYSAHSYTPSLCCTYEPVRPVL